MARDMPDNFEVESPPEVTFDGPCPVAGFPGCACPERPVPLFTRAVSYLALTLGAFTPPKTSRRLPETI